MTVTGTYLVSALLCPMLGAFADRYGQRITMLYYGLAFALAGHLIAVLHPSCNQGGSLSYIPFILYGICYTTFISNLYGFVPFLVKQSLRGTGYGIYTCSLNIGVVIIPSVISYIGDHTEGYFFTQMAFIILCVISLILTLLIHRWDIKYRNNLLQSHDAQ